MNQNQIISNVMSEMKKTAQTFKNDAVKQIFEWAKRDFNIKNVEVSIDRDSVWIQSTVKSKERGGTGAHGQLVITPKEFGAQFGGGKELTISGIIDGKAGKSKFYMSPMDSFPVKDLNDVKKIYDEKAKPVAKLFRKEYENLDSNDILQSKIKAIEYIIDGQTNFIKTLHANWNFLTLQEKQEYEKALKYRDERYKELEELKRQ
jgi:hypothetical protein